MYWINDKQQFCLMNEKINDYEPVSHISFTKRMHIVGSRIKELSLNLK